MTERSAKMVIFDIFGYSVTIRKKGKRLHPQDTRGHGERNKREREMVTVAMKEYYQTKQ